jgi:hypothetical protein
LPFKKEREIIASHSTARREPLFLSDTDEQAFLRDREKGAKKGSPGKEKKVE